MEKGRNIGSVVGNKRGQAAVEAVLVMLLVVILFLAVIAIGLYIYDMSVYVFAANKTMDMGITKLSEDNITLVDGISGNELDSASRQEMTAVALDALSLTAGTEKATDANVYITTAEYEDKVTLTIRLTGKYTLGIPAAGRVLPDFDYDLEYIYYY